MKKRSFAFLLLLAALFFAPNSRAQLSDSAFASVLTCGPGSEIYFTFGHSAIRICDPAHNIDYVYNYGTFDFDIPHFYWTFCLGNLNYCLSRTTYAASLLEFKYYERALTEQRLRLTKQELNNLFILLETNYLPEYRYYQYDFFRDNCATRVRDMVNNCLVHRTLWVESTNDENLTYRQLIYPYMEGELEWFRLGVDLLLGIRCDRKCSNIETMFSPKEIMIQLDTTLVSDTHQPLVDPAVEVLPETTAPHSPIPSPTLAFWVLFIIVMALTICEWSYGWKLNAFDASLYSITFLLSIIIIFLWFFSSHFCTKVNFNALWASPLFIYFAIRQRKSHKIAIYIQLAMLFVTLIACLTGWPQQMNDAILPIAFMLAVRLISNLRHRI